MEFEIKGVVMVPFNKFSTEFCISWHISVRREFYKIPKDAFWPKPCLLLGSSFTPSAPVFSPLTSRFRWQTACEHVQDQSWQVVFKAKDNYTQGGINASLATFKVLQIKIIAPAPQNLQATVTNNEARLNWDAPYVCDNAVNLWTKS